MAGSERLQELVPDAVLVGGSAAALYAGHRDSYDHDRVVADLRDRFDVALEALESEGEWVTNRVRPGKIIFGRLSDIETGVRQLIRRRPLETAEIELGSGRVLRVPTPAETLRVKAFLIVRRNQTRDHLDVAALSARYGIERAAAVLSGIDEFYADHLSEEEGVRSQLIRQLSEPPPADFEVTAEIGAYRNLSVRWTDWSNAVAACAELAEQFARG
ncbi:hypothetical protein [Glycomyces salinus]|uniref:hypothetical protein n=1 Tax=Glycomyces salinus TaxID=980294 RepID=UPI0018EA8CB4|nr:hypothetical protein [Glycomyces salinus]